MFFSAKHYERCLCGYMSSSLMDSKEMQTDIFKVPIGNKNLPRLFLHDSKINLEQL